MNNKQKIRNKEQASDKRFYFFSLASTGEGISGGDRIYIELARRWSEKTSVNIFTTQEGMDMMSRQKLKGKKLEIVSVTDNLPNNFLLKYIYKILVGIKLGMTLDLSDEKQVADHYLYSSSEFWMDVFPAVLLKIRFPKKVKWIATWYQTAPNPFKGFTEPHSAKDSRGKARQRQDKHFFTALLYWLVQLPVKPLINLYADKVIVNNEDERKQFSNMDKRGNVIVLIGAVRLDEIKKWKINHQTSSINNQFDAVFQGRFHPQKGAVELIDIWKKVVNEIPDAKLAMIGDGPLMSKVKNKRSKLKLEDNVELFGYVFDGPKKYDIFDNSKLVVHPAYYDSGGMASAEAMAFGIPVVAFDLKAYESYYPKGMIRAENEADFAKQIIDLLKSDKSRQKIGKVAQELIEENYSWDKRANSILNKIVK